MQSGRMKRWTVRSMLALAAASTMTRVAHAATDSWIGGGATASWSEDANWLFNRVATPPTGNGAPIANDNLIFASPTTNGFLTLINDLPAGTVLPSITFDLSAGAYDLTGNALSLSGSTNKSVLNNSAATETIEFPLTITGSRSVAATAGPIVLKGALAGSSGGAIFTGPFTTTLLAPAIYIQPSSTNTSGTQIQSGVLQIGTGGSLPTVAAGGTYRTASVALGASGTGGVLELGDATGPVSQSINLLSVASASTPATDAVIGGASTISTLTIDNTIAASAGSPTQAGNTSFTGILGGPGANQNNLALTVHMASTNNVTLQNTNTYVGDTNVTGGVLAIGTGTVPGSIASPNVNVSSGAMFQIAAMGAISASSHLGDAGTVNIQNAATTLATLNGSGALNLATSTLPTILTVTGGGSFSGNITSAAGGGSIVVNGGSLALSGSNSYSGTTTVQTGTLTLSGPNAWGPALNGTNGTIMNGGRVSFDYSADVTTDPVATIQTILTQAAFNSNFATGKIRTTFPGATDGKHAIGWNDDTTDKRVVVAYTYLGDANVDGQVTTTDFTAMAANFGKASGAVWSQGDFNYDGVVNALDFNMIAVNFGATPIAGPPALGTLVPEPATIGVFGMLAMLGIRRQRR